MIKRIALSIFIFLAACTVANPESMQNVDEINSSTQDDIEVYQTETVSPVDTIVASETPEMFPVDLMAEAENCIDCHSNLTDQEERNLSFYRLWRSGMMANAARDPYWLATVSSEISMQPELSSVIEDKCANCHMPMARFDAQVNGSPIGILGDGFLNPESDLHNLAMDGISCNLCHQIEPDPLGEKVNFSGDYEISKLLEWGDRMSYGPFPVNTAAIQIMAMTGFKPTESDHLSNSEFCGTCHTLFTPYVDAEGNVVGEFPEQVVYQEWENSGYEDVSCQECHMPLVTGPVLISSIAGSEKEYLREHSFVGSNAFMLSILEENEDIFGDDNGSVDFNGALNKTIDLLQKDSGAISFGDVSVTDGKLDATVEIKSMVGHKFPSGYPSRRVWVHFTVKDSNGEIVFESGDVDANGFITGNNNDVDASQYEPHYTVITDPDQVQIYEVVLQNTDGEVTTTLLRAAGFLKDNRLLPVGFIMDGVQPDIAPYGLVLDDTDFIGGSDEVRYIVDLNDFVGPFTVEVELLYQSISYRWAENLRGNESNLIDEFMDYYSSVDNLAVVVSNEEILVEE